MWSLHDHLDSILLKCKETIPLYEALYQTATNTKYSLSSGQRGFLYQLSKSSFQPERIRQIIDTFRSCLEVPKTSTSASEPPNRSPNQIMTQDVDILVRTTQDKPAKYQWVVTLIEQLPKSTEPWLMIENNSYDTKNEAQQHGQMFLNRLKQNDIHAWIQLGMRDMVFALMAQDQTCRVWVMTWNTHTYLVVCVRTTPNNSPNTSQKLLETTVQKTMCVLQINQSEPEDSKLKIDPAWIARGWLTSQHMFVIYQIQDDYRHALSLKQLQIMLCGS